MDRLQLAGQIISHPRSLMEVSAILSLFSNDLFLTRVDIVYDLPVEDDSISMHTPSVGPRSRAPSIESSSVHYSQAPSGPSRTDSSTEAVATYEDAGMVEVSSSTVNPATRIIKSSHDEAEGPDALEQRFHQLALEAKLRHPTGFQMTIDELYESAQRQGISPEDWPSFIERVIIS